MGPVVIVGGGIAGLCCALRLKRAGVDYLLLEASGQLGGRVRTDFHEGFTLNRGFQVMLEAYPEAQAVLDYAPLQFQQFRRGAMVRYDGDFYTIGDPWHDPVGALGGLFAPVGTLADKLRIGDIRARAQSGTLDELLQREEMTTLAYLREQGFSEEIIEHFFKPWLGGIFFEHELTTSSRMFEFVFRMFSLDGASLPNGGMQAIPDQLAAKLDKKQIRMNAEVTELTGTGVKLADGEEISADAVVVAAEAAVAQKLLPQLNCPPMLGVTTIYFSADEAPIEEPLLVLDGERRGPVNDMCVISNVVPGYAPKGKHLISVSVPGIPAEGDKELAALAQKQLNDWFGSAAEAWKHLRTYRITNGLPAQSAPALKQPRRPVRVDKGIYVCGDHRDYASINGAMESGRRAAEAVIADLA